MTSKRIRIVTDSVSDIPADLLQKYQIPIIPCFVNFNGESYSDNGVDLDRDEFYRLLPDMKKQPTTAAPTIESARDILQEALEGYDHIVSLHVSGKYSTTINNVKLAARELPEGSVTVLDSASFSMGIGVQAIVAAEVAQQTGDVQQVVQAIKRVQELQHTYAIFATLEYLRRSGRVNALIVSVGSLLQIKLIVDAREMEINPVHRIRTFRRAENQLEKLVRAQAPLDRLIVLHIRNEAGAREFLERVKDIAPADTPIVEVGPTLGTHIGPGSLGATVLSASWRDVLDS